MVRGVRMTLPRQGLKRSRLPCRLLYGAERLTGTAGGQTVELVALWTDAAATSAFPRERYTPQLWLRV